MLGLSRRTFLTRTAIATVAVALVATATQAVAAPNASGWHGLGWDLPSLQQVNPVVGQAIASRPVQIAPPSSAPAPQVVWPAAATYRVGLGSTTGVRQNAGNISIARDVSGTPHTDGQFDIVAVDHTVAANANVSGSLIQVKPVSGDTSGPLSLGLDYSGSGGAYGADYGRRLTFMQYPTCILTTPAQDQCHQATPLNSTNDEGARTVSADVTLPSATDSVVVAAVAGANSDSGDFAATGLSPAGSWTSGGAGGDFSYTYPIPAPAAVGGQAPAVALSYSSGSTDGLTAASNDQPSIVGDGWDLSAGGFIERSYKPCAQDLGGNNGQRKTGDACWATDNATLSFGSMSGQLVKVGDTWHPKKDDGSKVERLTTGSLTTNGDNDGEYWKVTTKDGTQAFFGMNHLPGWQGANPSTNSTWTEPVFGNNTGEPCNHTAFADSACPQAWRWNLDYVVDPHGNAIEYFYDKEGNNYSENLGTQGVGYDRGGYLDHIDYGLNANVGSLFTDSPPARIAFGTADRCASNATGNCDVPNDLLCGGSKCEGISPAFFSTKKLTTITTEVSNGQGGLTPVNRWDLSQSMPGTGDNNSPALWLDTITHHGLAGGQDMALPPTRFGGKLMANRVDLTHNYTAINRNRIETIENEQGGKTTVTYSDPDCSPSSLPTPSNNGRRCFPTYWTPAGQQEPVLDWFNKYVVKAITDDGRTALSSPMLTTYDYGEDANSGAWHFDENVLSENKYRTYSEWRGYDQVTTTKGQTGDGAGPQVVTKAVYLRGMDGFQVPAAQGDIPGPSVTDAKQFAGFPRESVTYYDNKPIAATISDPWSSPATGTDENDGTQSFITGTGATTGLTWLAAGNTWRTSKTLTTFDSLGQVKTTENDGDISDPSQSTCTTYSYGQNAGAWMMSYPQETQKISGKCSADNPAGSGNIITDVRTRFDGQDFGAAPTKGDVTEVDSVDSWPSGGQEKFQTPTSTAAFDVYGRSIAATDALGRKTTISYTPDKGGPVTQIATTSPPINDSTPGLTTTKIFDPVSSALLTAIDGSGLRTDGAYDAFGRLTAVWKPGESKALNQPANATYSYADNTDKPSTVVSNTLLSNGQYATSYSLVDGLGNTVQTQSPTPLGGRLVSDTYFDSQNRAWKSHAAYWNTVSGPSGDLLVVQDNAVANTTVSTFDSAGRQIATTYNLNGVEQWHTTSSYDGDRVTTVPLNGGTATTVISNGLGQKTKLLQYKDPTRTGPNDAADVTSYTYNNAGLLVSTTDPTGKNVWTSTYDLHGRKTSSTDPDAGTSSTTYNAMGDVLTTTDSRGKTLAYSYDGIGRKTGEYVGSTSGPQLAGWAYDTLVKGLPSSSTRYYNGNAYTESVYKYDNAGRPLGMKYTIPAAEGFLAGNYLFQVFYDPFTGAVTSQSSPAAGGLDAASIERRYDSLGNPTTLDESADGSDTPLVSETDYSAYGQVLRNVFADPNQLKQIAVTNVFDAGTGRLQSTLAERATASQYMIANRAYAYDNAGNIKSIVDTPLGSAADVQCFTTDYLQRLSAAWTPTLDPNNTGDDKCVGAPDTSKLGGAAPYWLSWQYDQTGNRTQQVQHAVTGDTTSTYSYPAPGSPQPHTLLNVQTNGPTGASQNSYTYDATGNTKTRDIGGSTQTYTYNEEGSIASEQDASGATSTYVNDAAGNRLITRDASGTTLSIGDMELHLPNGSRFPTGVRYYDFNGQKVAERGSVSGLSFMLTDHQGTAYASVNADNLGMTQRRQDPFGNARGPASLWPDSHGFVGGLQDTSGLTQLGARGYDSATGRFTQADPVVDTGDPQQMNGYSYASGSPISSSDPSGMIMDCNTGGGAALHPSCGHGSGSPNPGSPPPAPSPTQGQGGGASTAPAPSQPARSSCGLWSFICDIEAHTDVFVATVTVIAAVAIIACAVATEGLCLIPVAAAAADGAVFGASGMVISAAITAGAEAIGAGIAALGAGAAAAKVAEDVAGDAGSLESRTASGAGGGSPAVEPPGVEPPAVEPPGVEPPAVEPAPDPVAEPAPAAGSPRPVSCNSFAAGTAVLMADGSSKPIQDVRVGDRITNKDPDTGQVQTHNVVATHITDDDHDFVDLTVQTPSGTSTITVTANHLFWDATASSWVEAANLHVSDQLDSAAGNHASVLASRRYVSAMRTYNMTVDSVHTFYVFVGLATVLVHNCGPGDMDPAPGIVFRALAKGEDPALGLKARAPGAVNVSPLSHVAGKRLSPWISTSKLPSVAFGKYNQGNGVVAIDLSRIDGRIEDVSGGFPGKGRIDLYAKKDQEVLIFGHVPSDAIVGFWE
ncbi:RHS repeat-associated core domain-containing protein [Kutzneria sp. NPDC052558]|uniref:RHS repeat-associated core domain-containing protein n=1 Tax=Kutzneria sp. NPDC052558 TaxID=3364121 RepID=UPI0037C6523D